VRHVNAKLIERFADLAARRLPGQWVIFGGAALPLMGITTRTTLDIDVAGPTDLPMAATLAVMEIAQELGLPVESVNQAGAFFLRRVDGWEQRLVLVRRGRKGSVWRPDATLFILLKLGRLTETDLQDCLDVLALPEREREPVDSDSVCTAVRAQLRRKHGRERKRRLQKLLVALSAPG